ncbi:hypothetical protein BDBG_08847 [Blastomyces gilchristii SLH14081]|uniref:Uncharacterized protein n=1 Tax=Blastomyces gilchristii (strain SLH14081) TaxID=559298 RepID=A0A179V038_BLAGS|nr:uncharacterized protein BDBG_08847 [Blastomyces gilchristii SLH14081]OAT13696.1 hypothetical protein BDBG_08847 [Blastomyces gilchristii SLH14081]
MKILPVLFAFLTASAVGQSISPPTQANLSPTTQEVTVDEALPNISARGFGKFKNIFDKVKKGGDKGKKSKDKKPKDKPEKKKSEDKKKDEKELTESKTLSKKKFKFKSPKKSDGKGKGGGGAVVVQSMAPTGLKAPLLFIGGLFILTTPLMVH